ncbi:hypothetical protein [Salinimicrobium soli]
MIKKQSDSLMYFDENYQRISAEEFYNKKISQGWSSRKVDSLNHRILHPRSTYGDIENKNFITTQLERLTGKKVDTTKNIVVIYYPGKDGCNSSARVSRRDMSYRYKKMERKVNKIAESSFFYIYNDKEGLYEKMDGFREWYQDPDYIFQELFFKHHYSCSSFVLISNTGEFITTFGEFSLDEMLESMKFLVSENN